VVTAVTARNRAHGETVAMTADSDFPSGDTYRLPFRDRREAGRLLAAALHSWSGRPDTIVAAIPRGGLVVGAEISTALNLPLAPFLIRKLGVPGQEELSMGAITSGGMKLMNRRVVESLQIPDRLIQSVVLREQCELERRERLYGRGRPPAQFGSRNVIVADDGVATGASIRLAIQALRKQNAMRVIVAVPVAPPEAVVELRLFADEVVCLSEPQRFVSVGSWYEDFHQVSDAEVCRLLDNLAARNEELKSA
jgi:putative phosphoribosyl transferase